jgi:phosphoserine aminotransferase
VTIVIIRDDLLERAATRKTSLPTMMSYAVMAENNSLYNTPPTFSVYVLRNVLDEVKKNGGLAAMEKVNREKAKLLYDAIDERSDLYASPVEKDARSTMNVVWTLKTPELEAEFLAEAQKRGMIGLKGHRSVGGMRASIYNAVPLEAVRSLAELMRSFKK